VEEISGGICAEEEKKLPFWGIDGDHRVEPEREGHMAGDNANRGYDGSKWEKRQRQARMGWEKKEGRERSQPEGERVSLEGGEMTQSEKEKTPDIVGKTDPA